MNPFKTKKGLGRGLSSLIGDTESKPKKNKISISEIIRNKFQPRRNFDIEKMEELTSSIKERGILQPIIVRKSSDQSDKFEIIAGERRWQAAQSAGLHEVPVVEIEADNLKSLEFAIVENVQRSDLNPIEEAQGYKKLIEEFNYDQEKVSKFIGKSRAHVTNCLRLLSLPKEVILLVEENKITQGHARVLIGLDNAYFLARKIIEKKLSVRQTENLIRTLKNPKGKNKIVKDANIANLESNIEEKIGLKVFIRNRKNNSGQVTFQYNDLDQLNRLMTIIKSNY
tara:strand:+ start:191 stop:1039 length:849 start_codon:yes stop_codon:yes gene_type:complete